MRGTSANRKPEQPAYNSSNAIRDPFPYSDQRRFNENFTKTEVKYAFSNDSQQRSAVPQKPIYNYQPNPVNMKGYFPQKPMTINRTQDMPSKTMGSSSLNPNIGFTRPVPVTETKTSTGNYGNVLVRDKPSFQSSYINSSAGDRNTPSRGYRILGDKTNTDYIQGSISSNKNTYQRDINTDIQKSESKTETFKKSANEILNPNRERKDSDYRGPLDHQIDNRLLYGRSKNEIKPLQEATKNDPVESRLPSGNKNQIRSPVNEIEDRKSDKITYHKIITTPVKDYSSVQPRGLVGLRNIGNTCFMNSILQCLLNSPLFSDFFINGTYKREIVSRSKGVAEAFGELLTKVRSHSGDPSSSGESTYKVKSTIERVNSMFSGYDQHDAQEFLKALLEGINDDLNRITKKPPYKELKIDPKKSLQEVSDEWSEYMLGRDNSIVTDLFCGQLLSKIICSDCRFESLAFDNFWDLSLSFTRGLSMIESCDIIRMIEHFLKDEVLEDLFYCEKCKKRTKSTKRFVIWRLPKILVIHLKRFYYGKMRKEKITNSVQFPVDCLDLEQFVKSSTDSSTRDPRYSLFGIVNHSGSLSGGHYTAECMNPYNRRWYNFNDDFVRESAVSDKSYNSKGSSSPYVLFYIKTSCLNNT